MFAIKDMAILQEAKDVKDLGNNKVRFKAKLQMLNSFSYNGKKYLKEPMIQAIKAKEKLLGQNGFVGEMDHPIDPSMQRMLNVLYKNTSHLFKEIWTEGDEVWGLIENTSNDVGLNLYAFIAKDKIPVGFSLRALGDVRNVAGGQEVHKNIDLITWDSVSTPSFSNCILTEIMDTRHLESFMLKNDVANLEEFVYGDSTLRNQMILESRVSAPTSRLVSKLENICLYDSSSTKFNILRRLIKSDVKKKIYSL